MEFELFKRFEVTGYEGDPYYMKSAARKISHELEDANVQVTEFEPIRFERYGEIYNRHLTRREMVFGVKSPEDRKGGGFGALVSWCGDHVQIDMARARMVSAEEWIVDFIRRVIKAAGWTIQE